jgi:hypothetical protein
MMADNKVHHLGGISLAVGKTEIGKSESGARKRHRKPNLARALHEAKKAGVNVAGATLTADGSVSLSFGEAVKTPGNELDQWITAHENPTKGH